MPIKTFRDALTSLVNNYARHDSWCVTEGSNIDLLPCDCGLDEAKALVLKLHEENLEDEYERGADSKPDEFDGGIF
jgi:hypothetical protein